VVLSLLSYMTMRLGSAPGIHRKPIYRGHP
jgi:hypothetical protein